MRREPLSSRRIFSGNTRRSAAVVFPASVAPAFAVLMAAVVAALDIGVIFQRSGQQGLYRRVCAAGDAAIQPDTRRGQRRLRAAAGYYLAEKDLDCPARFDVAEVWDSGGPRRICYLSGPFV